MTPSRTDTPTFLPAAWASSADRRESPRLPIAMQVGSEAAYGNLSLGGIGWYGIDRLEGSPIRVSLPLTPGQPPLVVDAEVIRTTLADGGRFWMQARFVDIDLGAELAIARWIQDRLGAARAA